MAAQNAGATGQGDKGTVLPHPSTGAGGGSGAAQARGTSRPTGNDILSVVDGDNGPVFGVEEIEARKSGKSPKKAPVEGRAPGKGEVLRPDVQRAREAESVKTDAESPFSALDEAIQQELSRQDKGEGQLDEGPVEGLSEQANTRFRALVERASSAEARAEALETSFEQTQQQYQASQQQVGQYLTRVMETNARLQGQLDALMRGQVDRNLSPDEQIERDLINKGVAESRKVLDPQLRSVMGEVERLKKGLEQERKLNQINTRKAEYSVAGDKAAREVVLAGFSDEAMQRLMPKASRLTLSYAWSNRTNAENAAKMVRRDLLEFSQEIIRAQAKLLQQKRDEAGKAPAPTPTGKAGSGGGGSEPSFKQLRAAGYRGTNPFMDWELEGKPPLR